jgi:Co/Zn/Cd efflux system component
MLAAILMVISKWQWIDPLVGCINSIYLIKKAFPSALASGKILLQSFPNSIRVVIDQSIREVCNRSEY